MYNTVCTPHLYTNNQVITVPRGYLILPFLGPSEPGSVGVVIVILGMPVSGQLYCITSCQNRVTAPSEVTGRSQATKLREQFWTRMKLRAVLAFTRASGSVKFKTWALPGMGEPSIKYRFESRIWVTELESRFYG